MFGADTLRTANIEREEAFFWGWSSEPQEEEFDFNEEFNLERAESYIEEKGLNDEFEKWAGAYCEDEREELLKEFISNDISDFAEFLKED